MKETFFDLRLRDLAKLANENAKEIYKTSSLNEQLMSVVNELAAVSVAGNQQELGTVSERFPSVTIFEERLANVFIRLLAIVGEHKLDLEMAIKLEMTYEAGLAARKL